MNGYSPMLAFFVFINFVFSALNWALGNHGVAIINGIAACFCFYVMLETRNYR
jgi:lipopolysaccharide export LptBFGC system permease protein LptF